jgi:excisionase family DNA binding protein
MSTQAHALPELLTPREAADALRVSVPTLRRLIARGDLSAIRLGGRPGVALRIRADDLERLIAHPSTEGATAE